MCKRFTSSVKENTRIAVQIKEHSISGRNKDDETGYNSDGIDTFSMNSAASRRRNSANRAKSLIYYIIAQTDTS